MFSSITCEIKLFKNVFWLFSPFVHLSPGVVIFILSCKSCYTLKVFTRFLLQHFYSVVYNFCVI